MVGRSCRTRGVCEGTLYVVGIEKPHLITERLKKQGVVSLMDLERLLNLLEKKGKDCAIIRRLSSAVETGTEVKTLDALKLGMEEQTYSRLIKGMFQ